MGVDPFSTTAQVQAGESWQRPPPADDTNDVHKGGNDLVHNQDDAGCLCTSTPSLHALHRSAQYFANKGCLVFNTTSPLAFAPNLTANFQLVPQSWPNSHVVPRTLHVLAHILGPRDALVVEELGRVAELPETRVAEVAHRVLRRVEVSDHVHCEGCYGGWRSERVSRSKS